jgi:hypothetical protein
MPPEARDIAYEIERCKRNVHRRDVRPGPRTL